MQQTRWIIFFFFLFADTLRPEKDLNNRASTYSSQFSSATNSHFSNYTTITVTSTSLRASTYTTQKPYCTFDCTRAEGPRRLFVPLVLGLIAGFSSQRYNHARFAHFSETPRLSQNSVLERRGWSGYQGTHKGTVYAQNMMNTVMLHHNGRANPSPC